VLTVSAQCSVHKCLSPGLVTFASTHVIRTPGVINFYSVRAIRMILQFKMDTTRHDTTRETKQMSALKALLYVYNYGDINIVKAVPQHTYGGTGREDYSSYSFLISALDEGEWSASRPGLALPPGKEPPVGLRAGLDTEARRKISCLCRGLNLDRPVVQSVARHYTAWATRLTH
jgi:hypothetical protein